MKRHFHFRVQKVLPLVYDDSLSYYEVLCKLQQEIIDLGEDIETGLIDYIKEVLPDLVSEATYDDETGTLSFTLKDDESPEEISDDPIKRISVDGISRPVMDEIARAWFNSSWLYNKKICMYGDSTLVVPETYATKIQDSGICSDVTIRGISGQTLTTQGWPAIRDATDLASFDYIFVCYGINDFASIAKYQWVEAVEQTARRILNAGAQPVFVFPWKVYINTFDSNGFINDHGCDMPAFVDSAIDICEQLNVKYFNLCSISGVNEHNYQQMLTRSANGYYLHESDALGEFVASAILNGSYNTGKCYAGRFAEPFKLILPSNWGYMSYTDTQSLITSSPLPFRRGKAMTVGSSRLCESVPIGCGEFVRVRGYAIHPIDSGYIDLSYIDLYNVSAGAQHICKIRSGSDFDLTFKPSYQGNAFKLCMQASGGQNAVIMDLSVTGSDGSARLTSNTPSEPSLRATFNSDLVDLLTGGYIDTSGQDYVKMLPFSLRMKTALEPEQTLTIGNIGFYPQHPIYGTALNGVRDLVYRITQTGDIQLYAPPLGIGTGTYVFCTGTDITPTQFLY